MSSLTTYTAQPYIHSDAAFWELRALLVASHQRHPVPTNWLFGRLEDWRYGGNAQRAQSDPDFYNRNVQLWRAPDGTLAAFAICEYGEGDLFWQVHPDHNTVEPWMLAWMEEVWAVGRGELVLHSLETETARADLLRSHGFVAQGDSGVMRGYDLTRPYPPPEVPPGFVITDLATNGDIDAHILAVHTAFHHHPQINRAWYAGKRLAPSLDPAWDITVVAPDGRHASFATVYRDPTSRVAEIDPIGTQPDFQRRGLARAVILAALQRLAAAGYLLAYIGAAPEPAPSNRLYAGLHPATTYRFVRYVKALGKIDAGE